MGLPGTTRTFPSWAGTRDTCGIDVGGTGYDIKEGGDKHAYDGSTGFASYLLLRNI
jgi:hypothetical protein